MACGGGGRYNKHRIGGSGGGINAAGRDNMVIAASSGCYLVNVNAGVTPFPNGIDRLSTFADNSANKIFRAVDDVHRLGVCCSSHFLTLA